MVPIALIKWVIRGRRRKAKGQHTWGKKGLYFLDGCCLIVEGPHPFLEKGRGRRLCLVRSHDSDNAMGRAPASRVPLHQALVVS